MGVLRSIFIAILGPMVLYTLLIAHVIYQVKHESHLQSSYLVQLTRTVLLLMWTFDSVKMQSNHLCFKF